MTAFVNPRLANRTDYLTFLRGIGITTAVLPDDSMWIGISYDVSIGTVNTLIAILCPPIYPLAVYNLGADRLLNFAQDQPNMSFFADFRANNGLMKFSPGLISSAGDQGTSDSFEVIAAAKNMTISDLQMMRTPYGRAYLGIAQSYGPTIWGLS